MHLGHSGGDSWTSVQAYFEHLKRACRWYQVRNRKVFLGNSLPWPALHGLRNFAQGELPRTVLVFRKTCHLPVPTARLELECGRGHVRYLAKGSVESENTVKGREQHCSGAHCMQAIWQKSDKETRRQSLFVLCTSSPPDSRHTAQLPLSRSYHGIQTEIPCCLQAAAVLS